MASTAAWPELAWDYHALNSMQPEALLAWAHQHYGDRAGIITSFQDTGMVMIDMASKVAPALRVMTVDTLRLHDETYQLIDEIRQKYGMDVEVFQPDPERVEKMIRMHGEYLFFDSKAKQEYCCKVRKVEPNEKALDTLDVWFTGLRRDHSDSRAETPKVSKTSRDGRDILKVAPLAEWTGDDVWRYIREHEVPYNKLYDKSYTSIGCVICTTPTRPGEDKRAGRWRWFNALEGNKECGIHTYGSGI